MRLDLYLTEKGYFESRNKAKAEIDAGNITVNGKVVTKSSFDVSDNDEIELSDDVMPYVSRGGYKLEAAIKTFNLDFKDKVVLDIGASTGGFTDCSLQNGAKLVYAVDVGSNQLHDKLKNDKRVISYEETNILEFNEDLKPDFIVMDVSFVSIEYLLPGIQKFITEDNSFVCLIKPQFEIGKMHVKNGIVKDKSLYVHILENIDNALMEYNESEKRGVQELG